MSFFDGVKLILTRYWPLFAKGIGMTMLISMIGTVVGFLIGLLVGIVRTVPLRKEDPFFKKLILRLAKFICVAYVEVFRGTPLMIQAAVIYFGVFMGIDIDILFCALIIVSINTGAYMSEIIRGGIISVDKGQSEGAKSLGMTHLQTMITVVLPQAIRNVMPSVGNEFVVNIKDTSVLNVIGVSELYFQAASAAGTYSMFFESFCIAAVIYFILTFIVTCILRTIERRLEGSSSYDLLEEKTVAKPRIGGSTHGR